MGGGEVKIRYENLIDSETGEPFELDVPDNFEFDNRSEMIRLYARQRAFDCIFLGWDFANSEDFCS